MFSLPYSYYLSASGARLKQPVTLQSFPKHSLPVVRIWYFRKNSTDTSSTRNGAEPWVTESDRDIDSVGRESLKGGATVL